MIADSCDVIVIGAGPAGATAALLLASHGLRCIVVEARREPQTHPAAHVLSTRSMEIWREVGMERDIRALSAPMHELRCIPYCTTLAGPELGRVPLADLPDSQLDAIESISPTRSAHLPQSILEPLLWLNLSDNPRIDLRVGWKYLSHTDFADGVGVSIADMTTGADQVIVADYVVAADGSASHCAQSIGSGDEGPCPPAHGQRAFRRRSRGFSPPPPRPGRLDAHSQGPRRRHRAPPTSRPRISDPLFPAV